jgi:predicted phage terminase large subunit-like protein
VSVAAEVATAIRGSIEPQAGPQQIFLSTSADIAVYGGGAFCGKTYALLLDPLRFIGIKRFGAVIFRRKLKDLTQEGGLWDEASELYPRMRGRARESPDRLDFRFPWGSRISFSHLQDDANLEDKQGGQIAMIGFDQLEHFTRKQFFYMLSRNRSNCGVRPYMRATCNPDADSWLAEFLAWWIDQEPLLEDGTTSNPNYGLAIEERSGVLRYMLKLDEEIHWFDTRDECITWQLARGVVRPQEPKSVTFIHAKMSDNPIGVEKNPDYEASLQALGRVERARLLNGNWKIRASAGLIFQRKDFGILTKLDEKEIIKRVRSYDFAGTEAKRTRSMKSIVEHVAGDPDWTVGCHMVMLKNRDIIVTDMVRDQLSPGRVEELTQQTAKSDGRKTHIFIPQDPGQAGKAQVEHYVKRVLMGYTVKSRTMVGSKIVRSEGYAAYVEHHHVYLLAGAWNAQFLSEHDAFPTVGVPDDIIDAAAEGYNYLTAKGPSTAEVMARMRRTT